SRWLSAVGSFGAARPAPLPSCPAAGSESRVREPAPGWRAAPSRPSSFMASRSGSTGRGPERDLDGSPAAFVEGGRECCTILLQREGVRDHAEVAEPVPLQEIECGLVNLHLPVPVTCGAVRKDTG